MKFRAGVRIGGCLCAVALSLTLAGCGLWRPGEDAVSEEQRLAHEAESSSQALRGKPVPYSVDIVVRGVQDDVADALVSAMEGGSELVKLRDTPPDSRIGVERRAISDADNARDLLASRGYYDGRVRYRINWDKTPAEVRLILTPGKQYVLGPSSIERTGSRALSARAAEALADAPDTLAPFGLSEGGPALADQVLSAVEAVPGWFRSRGFPQAKVEKTRYRLYPERKTLDPLVVLDSGPFALYGPVQLEGAENIRQSYLEKLVPWKQGDVWNARRVERFREQLLQSGLFREVRIEPMFSLSESAGRAPEAPPAADTGAPLGTQRAVPPMPGTPPATPSDTGNVSPVQRTGGASVAAPAAEAGSEPGTAAGTGGGASVAAFLQNQDEKQRHVPPAVQDGDRVPVRIVVRESPARRTVVGLNYASDVGAGAQGFWEHRNLLGEGERLRLSTIVAQDRQELVSSFVKPAFGQRNQNFVSDAYIRKEETDSYDMTAWYVDGGLERRFSRRWTGSARVAVQGGRIKEDGFGWEPFSLIGVPMTLRRDGTDNLLNPTSGTRVQLAVTPYTGSYRGAFSLVRTQGEFSAYYAPLHKKDGSRSDRLVLAARYAIGGMFGSMGDNVEHIPGALRYYAGGGGSVRGYKYQSLGQRNAQGDPLGGLSFNVLSFEARIRLTENLGVVPFIDAGMVYDTPWPKFGDDLCWATGLGFRYYTPIGPVRLDVAMPLDNRNDDQQAFQVYISIGQAF